MGVLTILGYERPWGQDYEPFVVSRFECGADLQRLS
jgi:hypothetical protein